MEEDDHDARTIHCGNLNADKITEELLYELFLQAGPLERVCIPKDNGKNRQYAFVTYKYQKSVPYALSIFSGTKLFNRELRLNNRQVNKNNNSNNNSNGNNQSRGQSAMEPKPILPNTPATHQFQMQNSFGNLALRGGNNPGLSMNQMNQLNNMMPIQSMPQMEFPQNPQLDFQQLLQLSAQMLSSANGLGLNNVGNDNNEGHKHQSKMMHRHEKRSHNQNTNYSRGRNDRRRDRSRSRSREKTNDWVRNRGRDNKQDRRDRNHGNNRRR